MRVRQRDLAARLLADVRDRELRLDRVVAEELRERAVRGRAGVEEHACGAALVERESEAIRVRRRLSSAHRESGEREVDVGRRVALHAEELAHRLALSPGGAETTTQRRRVGSERE